MKYAAIVFSGLLLSGVARAAVPIDQVVVYPDRARVTRTQQVDCSGNTAVQFANVTLAADPESFDVSVDNGKLEGFRFKRVREDTPSNDAMNSTADYDALASQADALRQQLEADEATLKLAGEYRTWLSRNLSVQLRKAKPDVDAWRKSLADLRQRAMGATQSKQALAARIKTLSEQMDALVESEAAPEESFQVDVTLACDKARRIAVSLAYMVGGVQWRPAYEARANDPDQGGQKARHIDFVALGLVQQTTGEDWRKVRLVFSTAIPRANVSPPRYEQLRVHSTNRRQPGIKIQQRSETVKQDAGASDKVKATTGTRIIAADQGLSTQLGVPSRATVLSDGSPVRLHLAKARFKAQFAYRTVPRLAPFVYRVAETANRMPFAILPGTVDLFRNGNYVGRAPLTRVASGARFSLTFGAEEGLRVVRHTVRELEKDEGIFDKEVVGHYHYRYILQNFLSRPQRVRVADQMPVSELDEVTVTLDPKKTSADYKQNVRDGFVQWTVELKPGQREDLNLVYRVRYPAEYM